MRRDHYRLFSPSQIGPLTLPNRLVRSATWDPVILGQRQTVAEVLDLDRWQSCGGVGLIITGGLPVYCQRFPDEQGPPVYGYDDLRVAGIEQLAAAVREAGTGCRVVAQLETGHLQAGPSERISPLDGRTIRALTVAEIAQIVDSFVIVAEDAVDDHPTGTPVCIDLVPAGCSIMHLHDWQILWLSDVPVPQMPDAATVVSLYPVGKSPGDGPMRILIADNQPKVRRALRVLLEQASQVQIVGEAADAPGLLARIESTAADLVLLDADLPGLAMIQLLPALRRVCPEVRVIALSARTEAGPAALAAGTDAFVSKADPAEHLLAALAECQRQVESQRREAM